MTVIDFISDSNQVLSYSQGSLIFKEGDQSDEMFIVIEGEVKILKGGKRLVVLKNGQIFGEMALVDKSPRSASAVAKTDCKIVPVDEKQFTDMIQNTPIFALFVMRIMAERLRNTTNLAI